MRSIQSVVSLAVLLLMATFARAVTVSESTPGYYVYSDATLSQMATQPETAVPADWASRLSVIPPELASGEPENCLKPAEFYYTPPWTTKPSWASEECWFWYTSSVLIAYDAWVVCTATCSFEHQQAGTSPCACYQACGMTFRYACTGFEDGLFECSGYYPPSGN